nr:hypothetical protein [Streptomyces mirabilis]
MASIRRPPRSPDNRVCHRVAGSPAPAQICVKSRTTALCTNHLLWRGRINRCDFPSRSSASPGSGAGRPWLQRRGPAGPLHEEFPGRPHQRAVRPAPASRPRPAARIRPHHGRAPLPHRRGLRMRRAIRRPSRRPGPGHPLRAVNPHRNLWFDHAQKRGKIKFSAVSHAREHDVRECRLRGPQASISPPNTHGRTQGENPAIEGRERRPVIHTALTSPPAPRSDHTGSAPRLPPAK